MTIDHAARAGEAPPESTPDDSELMREVEIKLFSTLDFGPGPASGASRGLRIRIRKGTPCAGDEAIGVRT